MENGMSTLYREPPPAQTMDMCKHHPGELTSFVFVWNQHGGLDKICEQCLENWKLKHDDDGM